MQLRVTVMLAFVQVPNIYEPADAVVTGAVLSIVNGTVELLRLFTLSFAYTVAVWFPCARPGIVVFEQPKVLLPPSMLYQHVPTPEPESEAVKFKSIAEALYALLPGLWIETDGAVVSIIIVFMIICFAEGF